MGLDELGKELDKRYKSLQRDALKVLEIEAGKAIKLNFRMQGRPNKWQKKKKQDGRAILTGKTGRLQSTATAEADYGRNVVVMKSNLPYSKLHQEGGKITRAPRTYSFAKNKKTGGSKFARKNAKRVTKTTQGKGYTAEYPARPFLVFTKEDIDRTIKQIKKL